MASRANDIPKKPADSAGLIFVDDSLPGITRRRCGRGWSYRDAKGRRVADRNEIDRLNAIALPPAYTDAWFCPAPNGHILATGIDAKGRKQYRYHPRFRAERECEKFDRTIAFGKALPLLRKRVEADLSTRGLNKARAIACVVRLLDLGRIRIGNETYAKSNKSFGATTLRQRHAKLSGRRLRLRYKGKSNKLREVTLTDRSLLRFVKQIQDLPGQRLFQYLDDEGEPHAVASCDVNAYLREVMGEDFSAKDFRTFHASVLAFTALADAEEKVTIKAMLELVSGDLGNTPAVARRSYVHPAVVALVDRQESWRADLALPRSTQWMSRMERGLVALLETCDDIALDAVA
ncbi:DNA topoisomerase IB [Croceicoccus naphthovorans]|uniref:DNA topoisomerase n=1 Tax=Croceicoccus naphthovorans TaxID=1348774 RepID=A0A0G3XHC5_9SPHN|nr:DNA topoisomerase IB [Croceicoccus naphthovorans]AKM10567.1 DNA topoisomerase [Croceicoccus naphthovorans]